ncbi:plasmid mobilization relaxosome protein MobC [Streptomyces sp. AJS327]|uniref:plasmid mobilization protein n=1 Tax=Streptomyces sp. AJS327 TaxID=2545265 RepID=UPI0027E3BC43|nr:plasmid mobilization relaxosome protein MobC [Streptomyces sp. AJS327]
MAGQTGPGVPVEGVFAASPRRRLRQPAQRDKRVCPRFSADEYAELHQAASASRMTVGGYLAEAGLAAARAENPEAAVADYRRAVRELMASNRQAAAVGNNLNQLARHLNSDQALPEREAVHRLLARVQDVLDEVDYAVEYLVRR